ncbi:MAG: hypothetical protein AB1762_10600 [Gemmatimonadota bacterium]
MHFLLVIALAAAAKDTANTQQRDTVFVEVGSPLIDASFFKPHAARVRIYRGDTLTAEWINELTLGDSAGRAVHRWVTTSQPVPAFPNRVLTVLRQTYDAKTLAPLGYWTTAATGASTRLAIHGGKAVGARRTVSDTTWQAVELQVPRLGFFAGASDLVPIAARLRIGTVMVAPVWSPATAATVQERVFSTTKDTVVNVEGTDVRSVKVEERKREDRSLVANWYLLLESPYMVYGEVPLPDGRIQRMTEVAVPPTNRDFP